MPTPDGRLQVVPTPDGRPQVVPTPDGRPQVVPTPISITIIGGEILLRPDASEITYFVEIMDTTPAHTTPPAAPAVHRHTQKTPDTQSISG